LTKKEKTARGEFESLGEEGGEGGVWKKKISHKSRELKGSKWAGEEGKGGEKSFRARRSKFKEKRKKKLGKGGRYSKVFREQLLERGKGFGAAIDKSRKRGGSGESWERGQKKLRNWRHVRKPEKSVEKQKGDTEEREGEVGKCAAIGKQSV